MSTFSVPTSIIICLIISICVCFALPIVGYIFLRKRASHIARAFWFGALAFFVSQIVLRIPLLQLFALTPWAQTHLAGAVPNGLFHAFTAGLFEECARFLAFALLLKKRRRYIDGLAFGVGHGGCEAVLLVGLSLINTLVIIFMQNAGQLAALGLGDQLAPILASLQDLTPLTALLGGVERVLTLGIHIGLSVVVLTGFVQNKKWQYLLYAILAHTAVDMVVILPQLFPMPAIALEGIVLLCSAAILAWAWRLKRLFPSEASENEPPATQAADDPATKPAAE